MADIANGGDDEKVFEMIRRADTIGVFQIESRAQMSMLPRLRPRKFLRPRHRDRDRAARARSRAAWCIRICAARQGLEPVTYPSEAVKGVLERTLGVPIFQEQVMQLAMVAADFTRGRSRSAAPRDGRVEAQRRARAFRSAAARRHAEERLHRRNSPSASSARSAASANTAFPNRTPRASRCSLTSRRGSSITSPPLFSPRC